VRVRHGFPVLLSHFRSNNTTGKRYNWYLWSF